MAKDPEERYQSAHQLAAAARRVLNGAPTPAAVTPPPAPTLIRDVGDPSRTGDRQAGAHRTRGCQT